MGRPRFAPGVSLVADLRWSTATGSTSAALRDTDNPVSFDHEITCSGTIADVMSVVTASSAGLTSWPTPNALRLTSRGPTRCGNVEWSSNAGSTGANPNGSGGNRAPFAASQSHYGRLYFNVQGGFINNHGVAYNAGGTIQFVPIAWNSIASTSLPGGGTLGSNVQISIRTDRNGSGGSLSYPQNQWLPGIEGGLGDRFVSLNTTYRYEWYMQYTSATSFRVYPRLYDAGGTLLYSAVTWYEVNANPATYSLQDYYDASNSFSVTDAEIAREFSVGHEGPAGSSDNSSHLYVGALAFSLTDWVGGL